MPEIKADALTLHDLVGLGAENVTDRIPLPLLLAAARKYVLNEARNRRRAEARRAERRAYGDVNDAIRGRMRQASVEAALKAEVVWADILDVKLQDGGEGQTWGTATAEDHLFAAMHLESLGEGYVRTAAMHRAAVRDLEAAGAKNLIETTMGLR